MVGAALIAEVPFPKVLDADQQVMSQLLAVRDALAEDAALELLIGTEAPAGSRATLRHLPVAGSPVGREPGSPDGAHLVVIRVPEPPAGSSPPPCVTDLVRRCEAIPARSAGTIPGPASLLTERIADQVTDALRCDALRFDRVRCVVRLPEGLVLSRPGIALALWILGPERDIPADERWMTIADLSAVHLDGPVTDALVTDASASMGSYAEANRHASRIVRTSSVIARGGPGRSGDIGPVAAASAVQE